MRFYKNLYFSLFTKAIPLVTFFFTLNANAGFNVELEGKESTQEDKLIFGGFAKADVRHVNGDIGYQDYWVANFPGGAPIETSKTGFTIRESRFNVTYQHKDVKAFMELDFYGGGGNEVVSNSTNPRLRHFKIDYKNWTVGQTWTTFMPLHALPESIDFGGPHVGEVFIRQTLIRYTHGGLQLAIENSETNGDGDIGTSSSAVGLTGTQADPDESIPDFVAKYNFKRDWGQLSIGGLLRSLDQGGIDESAFAINLAGRIKTFGKDDFRFQVTTGKSGRYTSAGLTPDVVTDPETGELVGEEATTWTVAYRHFWTPKLRSSIYYGTAETDTLGRERAHWAINLITDIKHGLSVGAEFGNYSIDDDGIDPIDSNYLQFSAKYAF